MIRFKPDMVNMNKVVKKQVNYLVMLVKEKWQLPMSIEEKQKYFKKY